MPSELLMEVRTAAIDLAGKERDRMTALSKDETLPEEVRSALTMGATSIEMLTHMFEDSIRYGETMETLHRELTTLITNRR